MYIRVTLLSDNYTIILRINNKLTQNKTITSCLRLSLYLSKQLTTFSLYFSAHRFFTIVQVELTSFYCEFDLIWQSHVVNVPSSLVPFQCL